MKTHIIVAVNMEAIKETISEVQHSNFSKDSYPGAVHTGIFLQRVLIYFQAKDFNPKLSIFFLTAAVLFSQPCNLCHHSLFIFRSNITRRIFHNLKHTTHSSQDVLSIFTSAMRTFLHKSFSFSCL